MNLSRQQLIIFGVASAVILIFALVLLGILPGLKEKNRPQVLKADISVWGLFDPSSAYENIFNQLKTVYPGVNIKYRAFLNIDEYKTTLLEALSAGAGPDIFMIQDNDLFKNLNKISPLPSQKFSLIRLRDNFPQIVEQSFAPQGTIYALPLSIDTLALIYNRDALDEAAVTPPADWEEFQNMIPKLLKTDSGRRISRAAAAVGASKNIDKAVDLLNLLMLQTGAKMVTNDFESAAFASEEGVNALNFYTSFARPENSSYAWNENLPNSLEAFSQGTVAMILNYASALPKIKEMNAFLNIGVAPIPQPKNAAKPIAYPRFWGYAVSRQSRYKNLAWDIIIAFTANTEWAKSYTAQTKRPPALRSLINFYLNDPELHVFARQTLIAKSWPSPDPEAVEKIFGEAIDVVAARKKTAESALRLAQDQVTQLLQKKAF